MTETTLSRHSNVGDEWIRKACAENPIRELPDKAGRPSGNFTSGPVRLSFPQLFFPKSRDDDPGKAPKYGVQLNYPSGANTMVLMQSAARMVMTHFKMDPRLLNASNCTREMINGMPTPFTDQGKKITDYSTAGAWQMTASMASVDKQGMAQKPGIYLPGAKGGATICQSNERVMPDGSQGAWFYSGVWAIVSFNLYINKAVPEKQIPARLNGGLQNVMFLRDDQRYGGVRISGAEAFAGVVADPITLPGAEVYAGAGVGAGFDFSSVAGMGGDISANYEPGQTEADMEFARSMGLV